MCFLAIWIMFCVLRWHRGGIRNSKHFNKLTLQVKQSRLQDRIYVRSVFSECSSVVCLLIIVCDCVRVFYAVYVVYIYIYCHISFLDTAEPLSLLWQSVKPLHILNRGTS